MSESKRRGRALPEPETQRGRDLHRHREGEKALLTCELQLTLGRIDTERARGIRCERANECDGTQGPTPES